MKRVFIGGDFHCGHVVGLTPPEYIGTVPEEGNRVAYKHYKQRQMLWEWFERELDEAGPYDIALVNGDTIDGTGIRSGGTELLTVDRMAQVEMAASVIRRINAPIVYMTHGTAYHSGKEEDWELLVAREVGAEIGDNFNGRISGLAVNMRHFIGGTGAISSRFTGLNKAQVNQWYWSERKQQPKANLILRSHIHSCRYAGIPGENWAAWSLPALQGLGSKYGARAIDGLPVDFGFLVLDVESQDNWTITPHIMALHYQAGKTYEL